MYSQLLPRRRTGNIHDSREEHHAADDVEVSNRRIGVGRCLAFAMTPDHFHGDVGAHGMAHDDDAGPPSSRWLRSRSGLHEGVELVLDELDLVFHIVVMRGKGRLRLDFEAC